MIYKDTFRIGLDDLNREKQLKNKAILKILEDVAGFHSDYVHYGINEIFGNGIAWALLDWEIEIKKRPQYGDLLEVETWGRAPGRCHVYRDFRIFVNGELCVIATSKWMLMDLIHRRPMKIPVEMMTAYEPEPHLFVLTDAELPKLREPEQTEFVMEYPIRKTDIDINGHLHNTNYLDIAMEAMEGECFADVVHFRISYRKEIMYGSPVKVYRSAGQEGNTTCYILKNQSENEIHAFIEIRE